MNLETWIDWLADNEDADEATKLAALHSYIFKEATRWEADGEITPDWANKKLHGLGVVQRIMRQSTYILKAPVAAVMELSIFAETRAEALEKATAILNANGGGKNYVTQIQPGATPPVIVHGAEDQDVAAVNPDAPTTVDATLFKLREIILLAHIAGPRITCLTGLNEVLASFGLDPIPPRKTYTVGVPVEGVMKTTVEAYDEESAKRVAGWRWDNSRTGFDLDHVTDTDVPVVVAVD